MTLFIIGGCIGALITCAIIGWLGDPPAWTQRELRHAEQRYTDAAVEWAEAILAGGMVETRMKSFITAREALLELEDNA